MAREQLLSTIPHLGGGTCGRSHRPLLITELDHSPIVSLQYVDENYQGGGIGEYSYYDPYQQDWDSSGCDTHGNGRCAPMDCHLNNSTTWKLMGVFKEASYFGNDAFFEQLFKHEGVCVWNAFADEGNDLYEYMSSARESSWPEGCVSTGVPITNSFYKYNDFYSSQNTNGYLYIDLKPTWNGNMTYGLYTDSTCKYEYELPDADVESIAKKMGLLYGEYLQTWNDGLEVFKVCQPCRAYNLRNDYVTDDYNDGYSYYNDPNEGYFQCNDDADYTNVNQCMKFRTHAELEVATWEDLVTATNQGGILEVNVSGTIFGSERMSSEDYEYLIKMRQDELSAEARKAAQYRNDAARVEFMKPEVKTWSSLGGLSLSAGLLSLLGVACLLRRKHFGRPQEKRLKKPLLAKRDYFVNGPSGSMMTADLENNPSMLLPHNATAHTLPNLDEEEEVVVATPNADLEKKSSAPMEQRQKTQEFVDGCASSLSSLSYVSKLQDNVEMNETSYNVTSTRIGEADEDKISIDQEQTPNQESKSSSLLALDTLDDVVGSIDQTEPLKSMTDVELVSSYVDMLDKQDSTMQPNEEGQQDQEHAQIGTAERRDEADISVLSGPESTDGKADDADSEDEIVAARGRLDT